MHCKMDLQVSVDPISLIQAVKSLAETCQQGTLQLLDTRCDRLPFLKLCFGGQWIVTLLAMQHLKLQH